MERFTFIFSFTISSYKYAILLLCLNIQLLNHFTKNTVLSPDSTVKMSLSESQIQDMNFVQSQVIERAERDEFHKYTKDRSGRPGCWDLIRSPIPPVDFDRKQETLPKTLPPFPSWKYAVDGAFPAA